MSIATCQCKNCGCRWTTKVIADDPDTNCTTVEEAGCPECASDQFEIVDVEYESLDDLYE